jgi:hypothetical protein
MRANVFRCSPNNGLSPRLRHVRFVPIVLQKSQKPQLLNSRQRTKQATISANPLPESPVSFACGDVVPHIVVQSPRPCLGEFETHAAKRLLQHYLPIAEVADAVAALLRKSCFAEAVDINRFPQQSTNS